MEYVFGEWVFGYPYKPYYDQYKGHKFVIDKYRDDLDPVYADQVYIRCITDPNVSVLGPILRSDLVEAPR